MTQTREAPEKSSEPSTTTPCPTARKAKGAVESPDDERALLWVLNLSDGDASLLDIAARSGMPYAVILRAAKRLEQAGLLAAAASGNRAMPDLAPR